MYLQHMWLFGEGDSGNALALEVQLLPCELSLLDLYQTCARKVTQSTTKTCKIKFSKFNNNI